MSSFHILKFLSVIFSIVFFYTVCLCFLYLYENSNQLREPQLKFDRDGVEAVHYQKFIMVDQCRYFGLILKWKQFRRAERTAARV